MMDITGEKYWYWSDALINVLTSHLSVQSITLHRANGFLISTLKAYPAYNMSASVGVCVCVFVCVVMAAAICAQVSFYMCFFLAELAGYMVGWLAGSWPCGPRGEKADIESVLPPRTQSRFS